MNKQEIKEKIKTKFPGHYEHEGHLDDLVDRLTSASESVNETLKAVLNDQPYDDYEVAGYSVKLLQEKHGMNEIGALATIAWLEREPEKARVSLERGHDVVM